MLCATERMPTVELEHRGHRGTTEVLYAELSGQILKAAFKVHSGLGPGLLESAYEACMCHELYAAGLMFRRQVQVPIQYDGIAIDCGFRLDLLVEEKAIVEIKSVERLMAIHECQLLTYLRASRLKLGLLLNFNCSHLRHGIRRLVA
jgi:GxxExxY protein